MTTRRSFLSVLKPVAFVGLLALMGIVAYGADQGRRREAMLRQRLCRAIEEMDEQRVSMSDYLERTRGYSWSYPAALKSEVSSLWMECGR